METRRTTYAVYCMNGEVYAPFYYGLPRDSCYSSPHRVKVKTRDPESFAAQSFVCFIHRKYPSGELKWAFYGCFAFYYMDIVREIVTDARTGKRYAAPMFETTNPVHWRRGPYREWKENISEPYYVNASVLDPTGWERRTNQYWSRTFRDVDDIWKVPDDEVLIMARDAHIRSVKTDSFHNIIVPD